LEQCASVHERDCSKGAGEVKRKLENLERLLAWRVEG
jgi:hypothetical protein